VSKDRSGRGRIGLNVGLVLLAAMVLLAVLAPLLTPYGPNDPDIQATLAPPLSDGHLLGTDSLGRDLLTRIVFGARVSLLVSGCGMLLAMMFGVTIGLLAVFGGKWSERFTRWMVDVQLAFPYILLAIAITSVTTPSLPILVLLMVIAGWPAFARVVRGAALSEVAKDYVKAATVTGASQFRIARKYVLPQLRAPILVLGAMQMAAMVLFEATLSFLGMGVQPPTASWGGIMLGGQQFAKDAWWISTLPGFAILWLALSLSLIVDGLQRRFDTRVL
jgi:peptide/nickel transport system permease protein